MGMIHRRERRERVDNNSYRVGFNPPIKAHEIVRLGRVPHYTYLTLRLFLINIFLIRISSSGGIIVDCRTSLSKKSIGYPLLNHVIAQLSSVFVEYTSLSSFSISDTGLERRVSIGNSRMLRSNASIRAIVASCVGALLSTFFLKMLGTASSGDCNVSLRDVVILLLSSLPQDGSFLSYS